MRTVTLRLLCEFCEEAGGGTTLEAMQKKYPLADMVVRRLEIMREGGFVCQRDGRFFNTPKGNFFAVIMAVSSRIFQSKSQKDRL